MQTGTEFLRRLIDAMLPNRAAPALARVRKAHEGPGKTAYSVDVTVLKAGTLEDTEQEINDVPISPIWAGKKKRGLYAIPPEGQVVIIEFLHWNPAYPYIAGIWADEYEADEFSKDKFVLTDGDGMKFVIDAVEKSITIDNGQDISVVLGKEDLTAKQGDMEVVLKGGKAAIKNGSKSLFTILDTHFKNVMSMKTVGSPAQHVLSPDDITKITQDKSDLAALMEA